MNVPVRLSASRRTTVLSLTPIATSNGLVCRLVLRARVRVAVSDRESAWMLAVIDTGATRTRVPESLFSGERNYLADARPGQPVLLTVADGRPIERPGAVGLRPSQMIPTRHVDLVLAPCLKGDSLHRLAPGEPSAAATVVTGSNNRGPAAPACWLCPAMMEGIVQGSERDRLYAPPSVLLGMDFLAYWKLEVDQSRQHYTLTVPDSVAHSH